MQPLRAERLLERPHQHATGSGATRIVYRPGPQHCSRARRSRQADRTPRHTAPAQAEHTPPLLVDALGWSAIVWQQHPLYLHRLSTAWTQQHPPAVVTSGWRWRHLSGAVLE
jgi:hypothetical protein